MGPTSPDAVLPTVTYSSDEFPSLLDHSLEYSPFLDHPLSHPEHSVMVHDEIEVKPDDNIDPNVTDDTTLEQLLAGNKRYEPHDSHVEEHRGKRARLDTCSILREQKLSGVWETIKSNMENPWKTLDWAQKECYKPVEQQVIIIKTHHGWGWNNPRPCDKRLLAQVKSANQQEEEEQAIQLHCITKHSSLKRIN